jgi:uncharacterized protein
MLLSFPVFFILLILLSLPAEEVSYPNYTGYVNDFAKIFSARTHNFLTALCGEIENKTTAQVAIVVVPTTKPLEIEEYAVELFEKWGIGRKEEENGVLILIALEDRKIRIEVGYGLEGVLSDAICKQIIERRAIPAFKKGEYGQGVISVVQVIGQLIGEEQGIKLELAPSGLSSSLNEPPRRGNSILSFLGVLLFLSLFGTRFFFWPLLFFLPTGRRRGGYWYGSGYGGNSGGFSGGFGGFGGGLSGGGGASGSW